VFAFGGASRYDHALMRRTRCAWLAVLLAGAVGTAACTSFDSTPSDTPAEAGVPEGSTADAENDGAALSDATPRRDAAAGPITVAHEDARTAFVATDAQFIYWWSVSTSSILRADKTNPSQVGAVVVRPLEAVNALAVDGSGIYWLEVGPDPVQNGSRLMQLSRPFSATSTPNVLKRAPEALALLAVDSIRALTTYSGGVLGASKAGAPINFGLALDGKSLASDGMDAFYTFMGSYVYRLSSAGGSSRVIGLPSPRELNVEGPFLYGVMDSDGGSAIFKTPKNDVDAGPTAATPLTQIAGSAIVLALDNLGVVWGNAGDGSIHRVDRSGGALPDVVSGLVGLNAIAADANGVYWTTDTGIVGWAPR
jgi:hypothetical protein